MKTNQTLRIAVILLLLAGGLTSCNKNETVADPAKIIIGKWELKASHHELSPNPEPWEPSGYYEFRQNGTVVRYDYAAKEYTFEAKYWIEPMEPWHFSPGGRINEIYKGRKWWALIFQVESDIGSMTHISSPITFFSKNRMDMIPGYNSPQFTVVLIYNRKN